MQVLLRAAQQVALRVAGVVPPPRQRAQIGEDVEQAVLAADQQRIAAQQVAAGLVELGREPASLLRVHVVAEHQPLQALELLPAERRPLRLALLGGPEEEAWRDLLLVLPLDRVELQQRCLGVHLDVGPREDLTDASAERRDDGALHLHALHHGHHLAALHLVARLDRYGHDHSGGEAADEAAVVTREPVGDPVHLDEQLGPLRRDHGPMGVAAVDDAALVVVEALDLGLDADAVRLDPVEAGPHLADAQAIPVAAMAQFDGPSRLRLRLGPAAARECVEARPLEARLDLRDLDRGLDQRHVGVRWLPHVAAELQPVEPGVVHRARPQVRVVEQLEQEALVGGAVAQHDHRLPQRPAQPRDRLVAVLPPGDQLRHHRVELGGYLVPLPDAGVHAHPRPARKPQHLDPARRRREAERRVLGVQPGLDRVPPRRGRIPLEAPARGDVELELDQVKPGDGLGHGMLHLEPGVHLHEGERALLGLVEELDGGGAAVARLPHQAGGRLPQLALLLRGQGRARGLLDHLLAAPLHAAVAHPGRPDAPLAVGDRLHLDVAGRGRSASRSARPRLRRRTGPRRGRDRTRARARRGHPRGGCPARRRPPPP